MPTSKQLQAELSAAKAEIARLQQQSVSLHERLAQVFLATELPATKPSAPTRPPQSPWQRQLSQKRPSLPDSELSPPTKIARPAATKPLPSQAAAARTFSPPSANQNFKYLYVPAQHPIPISQLRSQLRRLQINSSRVLDIHYPDHHLVVLLIHNDYESDLCSQPNKFTITVRNEYDPLDPANLRDTACSKWSYQGRVDYAFGAFTNRLICAIRRIRAPVERFFGTDAFPEIFHHN
ncbi:hypothetical protein BCV72DRAFT_256428 [Rhizopus microsporus var. microsporus]|uniref:Uncharacterized protein n=1 Tax=Rhizopus microsporus var. microsporus TaxID=86635 RepID=A0A1X0R2K3_RHIZD|nr:hypothetical protein BCV72DRAFT_256428 [Rhizopus microsporus var. microsporus]